MLYRNPMEVNGNEMSLLGSQKLQELPMYQPFYKKPSKWMIQFRNYRQFVNRFDNFQLIQNHRRIWIYFTFKTWYLRFNIIDENVKMFLKPVRVGKIHGVGVYATHSVRIWCFRNTGFENIFLARNFLETREKTRSKVLRS